MRVHVLDESSGTEKLVAALADLLRVAGLECQSTASPRGDETAPLCVVSAQHASPPDLVGPFWSVGESIAGATAHWRPGMEMDTFLHSLWSALDASLTSEETS